MFNRSLPRPPNQWPKGRAASIVIRAMAGVRKDIDWAVADTERAGTARNSALQDRPGSASKGMLAVSRLGRSSC